MDFGAIVDRGRKVAADNSPTILTAIGVTGAITTAVLAGKAGFKAAQVLGEESPYTEPKEKFELTWKLFIPAIGTGTVTVICIVLANRVSSKRSAAMASAYAVSQEAFREYKTKVIDKLGEPKERKIADEVSQDRVNKITPPAYIVSNANSLWMDLFSGRYFDCDMETIRAAVNDINEDIIHGNFPSLTEFWEKIGLAKTTESDELGWNTDNLLYVNYAAAMHDGRPVGTIEFRTIPVRGHYKMF